MCSVTRMAVITRTDLNITGTDLYFSQLFIINPSIRLVLSPYTYIGVGTGLCKKKVQNWTVRFHETSLLILSLLIILDYSITV